MKQQETKPARRRWPSPEMITALSAILIGICALGVSLYETTLIRQAQKGSAWPYLGGGYGYNREGFRYFVENAGVGPAKIEYIRVTLDDSPVRSWEELID
ncbi:MAG: hypothetical protein CVV18_03195, partial [Gammaproteobacteria bacterium HGW-Gammaproteobacteria-8]